MKMMMVPMVFIAENGGEGTGKKQVLLKSPPVMILMTQNLLTRDYMPMKNSIHPILH